MLHDVVVVGAGPVGVDAGARARRRRPRSRRARRTARRRDAARRSLARAVARRAADPGAARRLGRAVGRAEARDADRAHRHFAGRRLRADAARRRTSTAFRRWATSSAIARCRRRSMRRSRATASRCGTASTVAGVRGTSAHAAVEFEGGATPARRRSWHRFWHDSPRWPTAPARRSPASRGSATITGRSRSSRSSGARRRTTASPSSASRRTGPMALLPEDDHYGLVWTATPDRARGIARARRRRHSSPSSRAISARAPAASPASPIAARFRSCSNLRARAGRARAASRSAMRRRRCIRSRGRDSMSGCATRGSSRRSCSTRRATRSATRAMLRRYSRGRRTDRWRASRSRTDSSVCSATIVPLVRWPRGLALTLLDARSAGEARVHARDAVRPSLAEQRARRARTFQKACHFARVARKKKSRAHRAHRVPRNGYNPLPAAISSSVFRSSIVHIGHYAIGEQSGRRADGGRHRSAVSPVVQAAGRGLRGVGDGRVESAAVGHARNRSGAPIIAARWSRSPCRSPAPIRAKMADAARYNVERGAQIIDINMGCPAKKVCNVAAGSALLANEPLVAAIVDGRRARGRRARHAQDPHRQRSRAPQRARDRADRRGRRHPRARRARPHARLRVRRPGRNTTRSAPSRRRCAFRSSPTATSPRPSRRGACSTYTGADAIMIGRAAQGRPWIFREIRHYLDTGDAPAAADGGGGAGARSCGTRRPLRVLRRGARACASRASISAGTRRSSPAARRSAARSTRLDTTRGAACRGRADSSILSPNRASGSTIARRRGDRGRPAGVRAATTRSQRGGEALAA